MRMNDMNVIYGINGPVVTVKESHSFSMMEMVYVGEERLVGEVIGITSELTTIQVYEETTGLRPGEPVIGTGSPMNVTLGPGILDNIFDGIERPLKAIEEKAARSFPAEALSLLLMNRGSGTSRFACSPVMKSKAATSTRCAPKRRSLNIAAWCLPL